MTPQRPQLLIHRSRLLLLALDRLITRRPQVERAFVRRRAAAKKGEGLFRTEAR